MGRLIPLRYGRWLIPSLVVVAGLACGADDDLQAPAQPVTPSLCPPLPEMAPRTFALIEGGALPATRALLADRFTDAQISALIDGVLTLLRALDTQELDDLAALAQSPAIDDLAPLILDLVRWIAGTPTDESTYQRELISEARRLVGTCDSAAALGLIESVAVSPELPRLLQSLGGILALDQIQDLLGAGEALDRDGFTVLVCNILAGVTRSGFSVEADIIEPLRAFDLLPLDEPPLAPFLADLSIALDADGPILPPLADLVCCDIYGVQRCSAITAETEPLPRDPVFTWAMHALFTGGVIDIETALRSAGGLIADPAVGQTLAPLTALLDPLIEDDELRGVVDSVLVTLLDPNTARPVLHELLMLVDAGAIDELLTVADAVIDGCEVAPMESTP